MASRIDRRGCRRTKRSDERGFAIITALIMTMVITIIGLSYYGVAGYEIRQAHYQRDYAQAFWAAETGLDRTIAQLEDPLRWIQPPTSVITPFTGEAIGNATYDVTVQPDANNPMTAEKVFTVVATGRCGNAVRIVEEVIRLEGFQRYGYFSDEELSPTGQPIWFVSGDVIGGRTHTNGIFHFAGSPRFLGPVTTASDYMVGHPNFRVYEPSGWPAGSNNPRFDDGLTLGVDNIPLPNDTGNLRAAAQNGGLDLTGNYEMKFVDVHPTTGQEIGTLVYKPLPSGNEQYALLGSITSGVIHVTGNIQMSGTVDGRVTVAASGDIEIVGDISYKDSVPGTGQPKPGCDDMMGIVAGQNIIIKDIEDTGQGPNADKNLIVDATVMALNTSFKAENHNINDSRGTLHIWGGLIQKRRGQVGYSILGQHQHGYMKDYHYDERVTGNPPPNFPLTGHYTRLSWSERGPDA